MFRKLFVFSIFLLSFAAHTALAKEKCLTLGTADDPVLRKLSVNIKAALEYTGLCTKIVFKPSLRVTHELKSGQLDGDLLRTWLYEKHVQEFAVRVPEPHLQFLPLIATVRDDVHSVKDLRKAQLGIYRDQMWMKQIAKTVPADQNIPNYDRLFTMLQTGHIDTVLLTPSWKPALLAKVPHARIVPMKRIDTFVYLHKRHQHLVDEMARAIALYKKEGGLFTKPPSG